MHQLIANATWMIECGRSRGSAFSFRHDSIVVSNYHVVAPHHNNGYPIYGVTEDGQRVALQLLAHSPADQFDYAVLKIDEALPTGRHVLQPTIGTNPPRGTEIIFAGFPHGISDLLVHTAIVSGFAKPHGFYIDGSVNGGNSGGPIVEETSGSVVGIVTQRRFLGVPKLDVLRQHLQRLAQHCQAAVGHGSVEIMGVDFGRFAQMMAEALILMDAILQANANSGIGIGFSIKHVNQKYDHLGLP